MSDNGSIYKLFGTEESQPMKLVDPRTGDYFLNKKEPVVINLTSKDTPACKLVISAFRNRFTRTQASPAALERFSLDLLVAATTGWDNVFDGEGKPLPFSKDNCRKIYEGSSIIRNQVDEFVGGDENFLD